MQKMLQDFKAGELALSQDTTVSLWKEYRIWYGEIPLQETCGGSFVVIDENMYEELDAFKTHAWTNHSALSKHKSYFMYGVHHAG